jgi:amino acid adenylation domain-containing protein
VESLTKAFATDKKQFCILGSVKGNVGHADTAAGVVGLAKVALCLNNKFIPGTVNYEEPNPKINFENTPFIVKAHGTEWKKENVEAGILRAGINSFGVGGTNVHVVLEEAPEAVQSSPAEKVNLLTFSAKTPTALEATSKRVLEYLLQNPGINVSDAAWTLKVGRKPFPFRKSLVINDEFYKEPEKIIKKLEEVAYSEVKPGSRDVYLMFPGQGSQYQGMGRELYFSADKSVVSKIFKTHIDEVFELLNPEEQKEFLELMYGNEDPQKINQTQYTQFALFATSYALAKTMIEIGIKPKGMIGHSIGEVIAAVVAGVFELKDAVEIVRFRGKVMQKQEPGIMLSVMAPASEIEKELEPGVWLALENTTGSCVVGGRDQDIAKFEEKLKGRGINCTRVRTSHAFHTPMMEKAAQEFEKMLSGFTINEPQIPIVSNVSGTWAKEGEMTSPSYWSEHILRPVKFSQCLAEVLKNPEDIFIEVGAGNILSSFARQHECKKPGQKFINLIRHIREAEDDVEYLNKKLGQIWCAGVEIDWDVLKGDSVRKRVSLPAYVFDKIPFPIEVKMDQMSEAYQEAAVGRVQDTAEYVLPALLSSVNSGDGSELENAVIEAYKSIFGFDAIDSNQDFFEMGGDSLKAVSLSATLKKMLGVKVEIKDIFAQNTPAKLAAFIRENNASIETDTSIRPAEKADYYPLSSSQRRMYTFYLMDKKSLAYNLYSATLIEGELEKERTEEAVRKLILRHESLRTSFHVIDGQIVQKLNDIAELPIAYSERKYETEEDLNAILKDFVKPFDLSKAPLFRIELVKVGENRQLLLFDIHHIIADGTAVEILTRDFNTLYFGELEPLKIHYKDYAIWQNNYMQSEEMKKKKEFWLNHLSGEIPKLEMPTDFERPHITSFKGGRVEFYIDKELTEKIGELSRKFGATNFMTMLSAWYVLLAKYSGQEEIIVGTPVSGRTRDEIRETVGMFVNMLAIRSFPSLDKKYDEFLNEVKENTFEALKNQDYQFDTLVEHMDIKRELNRNPVFDVSFDYHNMETFDLEVEGLKFIPCQVPIESVSLDLLLTCNEENNGLACFIDYSTSLFKRETIERMAQHYINILCAITKSQDIELGQIDMLTEWDRELIFGQFKKTSLPIEDDVLIQEMFERNAKNLPDKVALVLSDGREITYRELNHRANILAWKLIDMGIKEDTMVGIIPERDENLIVAMLGILKAGGAYVPIDPKFPADRISHMVSQSNINVLICPEKYRNLVDINAQAIDLSKLEADLDVVADPPKRANKDNLAYVIFTSGSTGTPKGVMVKHEGVVNLISDHIARGIFSGEDDRIICMATPSFDIFVFESLLPLCTGHSIYMADETEYLDSSLLGDKIVQYKVTHIQSPVSKLRAMVENPNFGQALSQLKVIVAGGENYPVSLMKHLQKHTNARLYNMYGPTETTVTATVKDLTDSKSVTIGEAIANTQLFVISEKGMLQPVGVYGELCIAGRGLSKGYINNPEETANRFVKLPEDSSIDIYRTGDCARMLDTGEFELKGRLDSQVKIRGYRIELGEIENIAMQNPNVSYAVAKAFAAENGNSHLALFYCDKEENGEENKSSETLKDWLMKKLPNYMMPTHIIKLDKMPLLPNGKVNKRALTLPEEEVSEENKKASMPMKRIEKEIIKIWKDMLGVQHITVKDNFFDIGGTSYTLMLVNNRLNELLGYTVPLMQLFENPTVELLAKSFNISENSPLLLEEDEIEATDDSEDIAVIGMYGRFPGADGVEELWNNIVAGKECLREFSDEELKQSGIPEEEINDPNYVRRKGYLEGVEYFDADFFNYSRKEANTMDPQIRLLHMCVWNALENAGYNPFEYSGKIGLFAGSGANISWLARYFGKHNNAVNSFEVMTLNDKDFVTTKVSYKLNLKGPSVNVQTACSTSLVAIHQAVKYLQCGEADIAVAGGVSISYPRKEGYLWHEGMIFSKDGHCRPFSENASGTVSGNGCAIVVLKKLDRAIKDNDHIYAVIKGSAINNDGIEKIGYTAPSISGQRDVIEKALKKAKIKPEEIQYVEAHGTGTTLGDPIEIEALKQAWKSQKKGYCAIGSVKANIGHLDAAAGVTGCIKAIQVLNKRVIPPMINFKGINPRIDIENSPFYINTSAKTLSAEIARAAVSSFGIGGTNAHVILEEAPKVQKSDEASEVNILLFSARSENALINTSRDVLDYIVGHRELNMSDVAWTLQVGRGNFEYRKAIVVKGKNLDNSEALQTFINDKGTKVPDGQKTVLLMLADSSNLAKPFANSIYKFKGTCGISKKFEDYVQVVLGELTKTERMNLEKQLADDGQMSGFENDITVFIMNYSLCMTLKDIGVLPDVIYGERIGKLSGLVVAGSISLGDAVQIIRTGIDKDIYPSNYPDYQWRDANVPVIDSIDAELKKELNSSIVINAGCNDKVIEELGTDAQAIIPVTDKGQMDVQELYQVLGMLWCNGCKVDWYAVHKGKRRARIPLPGYVFDKIEFDSDVVLSDIFNRSNDEDVKKVNTDKPITSFEDIRDELMKIWNEVLGTQTVGESDDFFELGGDSLNAALFASLVKKKLEINIPVSEIFNNSRFGDLVNWLYQNKPEQMANKEENQIRILEKQPYYETSSAQKRMYAVSQLIGDALSYNLASVYLIEGKLDRPKLEETFNTLVMRHESFRTYFGLVDGQVVQYIADEVPSVVEFANVDEKEVFEEINRSIKPFDLSKAPLMRVKFISVSDVKHYAVIDMHHIISDQSSIDILLQEFTMIYKGEKLPKNEVRYIDFAAWQNQLFKKGLIEKQIDYWMKELSGEIPVLDMYTDFQAPQGITHKGKILHFSVDKDNSLKINQFAKELRITPYMLMMASLKLLLYKYSGQKDLIIGTAVAGRNHLSLNTVVGMFVNLLPIRSQIDESLSVKEYLGYIKDKMVAAFENQDCQFDMIVEKLNMDKGSQDNPLFNVVINYVNMGTEELEIENLTLTPWLPEVVDTKYNIHVTILEKDNVFDIDVEYSIELFKEESMELFGKRFVNMVNYLVEHQDSLLSEISLVTPEEENWLYNVINNTKSNAPIDKNVVHLFEESVRTYGDRIALNWENEDYTYKELNSVVNQLAQLIADKGIKYGDKVAILTERSPIQIISILAILKCGAVYLPIDYKFPDDRVNFMLGDSGAKLLLTYSHHVERIEQSIEYLLLDSKEAQLDKAKDTGIEFGGTPQNLCGEDEAYILYTSGSTGKPKGAIICHKSIIRTVLDTNYVSITPEDKVLQMTNYTFDPSVFDIFGALLNGATLVMVPHEAAFEMPMLAEIFESKGITVCEMVTSVFNMIVDYKVTALKNVRKMYIGGEEMSLKHTKKAFEALGPGRVVNVYGPTEATVIATYYPIEHFDPEWTSIPIGKPISHTEVYVLDEEGRLLPPNMPGELCIGGCGVAKGYLNRKELTESKFINLPFGNGERVYRTGDRVLMTAEGDLIFLGRIDFQIKLRGFRIELGEVEKLIASVDGVKDVTVVANKDNTGSMYIAAYYTVDGDGYLYITPDYIRAVLQKQVPEYMIPSRMKRMDKLPLTENGKVNRKALPAIHEESVNVNKNGPRNEEERLILDAMREVLGNPGLGVKDDFFVMGGHSIKAIELAQKLREIGYELRVNDIFKFSTTEELAKYLGSISSMSREESPAQEGAQEHGKGTISLNEKQIDSMVQYICNSTSMVSDMMVLSSVRTEFPMSPVQTVHMAAGSRYSGLTINIEENISEQHLRDILANIIAKQQMMHCIAKKKDEYLWSELDVEGQTPIIAQSISYTKLDMYDETTQKAITKKVIENLMYKDYREGELPWRLSCLRLSERNTLLIWCFDHTCFDGMSAEIIKRQILSKENLSKNSSKSSDIFTSSTIQCYEDYVAILKDGPKDIDEQEIVGKFRLDDWSRANAALMEKLEKVSDKNFKEVSISVPLNGRNQNVWACAYELVEKILQRYTGENDIAMAIVDYGRKYGGAEFYDCVGEFLDIIPVMLGQRKVEELEELLDICNNNSVNFLSLIFDKDLSEKYSEVSKNLKKYFATDKSCFDIVIYNFQGFISAEDRALMEESQSAEETESPMSKLFINANHDKDTLYLSLECPEGLNIDLIKTVVDNEGGTCTGK